MSGHDRRQRNIRASNKSPIATPPRVALQGRPSRQDHQVESQSPENHTDQELTEGNVSADNKQQENGGHDGDDKAARIIYLEKEMAIMEEEFSRELELLGEKLSNESEIATFWQQKHSTLNQQFLKTDTDLRILRHENTSREKQREERERDIKTRISSLLLDRDTLREGYHSAKLGLQLRDEEIVQLRSQVKGLKDFVSANSRTSGQVTDEVFGEMMQRLGNGLQNWVIQNFRKAKIDPTSMKEEMREQLLSLVPTYEILAATSKIYLIQSIISRLLVNTIFGCYFAGLPEERAVELRNLESYLVSLTGNTAAVNQWRSSTLATLGHSSSPELQSTTEAVKDSLVSKVNSIMHSLSDVQRTEARDQSLRALLDSCIDLSRLLRVQKAVFKAFMPLIEGHQINAFDPETMEDIGGEDEDTLQDREIQCVAFPGMMKEGDESGEHAQLRNIISKARVLCSPD